MLEKDIKNKKTLGFNGKKHGKLHGKLEICRLSTKRKTPRSSLEHPFPTSGGTTILSSPPRDTIWVENEAHHDDSITSVANVSR
jgi:hypothetical protein